MTSNRFLTSLSAIALAIAATPALAGKPVSGTGLPFGNGFPSGEHYNLNIIGKKAGFGCPAAEVDLAGNPIYGNVIFFPREQGNDPITILVESGSKGPRGSTGTATLEVTDWCTESFPDAGSGTRDGASFRLPANAGGYAVYARITGKPGENGEPTVTFNAGEFAYVEDESGNDMILLGSFKDGATTIYRTSQITTTSKSVRKATDITGMFQWSGLVCSVPTDQTLANQELCCQTDPTTGSYINCQVPETPGVCPVESQLVQATCTEYATPTWAFNIADFVGYLWDLDTTGAYVVQLRFYPLK